MLYFKKIVCLTSILTFYSCNKNNCDINSIKTLFTTVGYQEGKNPVYGHYILLDGFEKSCLDSTEILEISHKYIDSLTSNTPATVLMFYSSEKNFTPNSKSHVQKDINKDCLVKIRFDKEDETQINFMFYDNKGLLKYHGNNWSNAID